MNWASYPNYNNQNINSSYDFTNSEFNILINNNVHMALDNDQVHSCRKVDDE